MFIQEEGRLPLKGRIVEPASVLMKQPKMDYVDLEDNTVPQPQPPTTGQLWLRGAIVGCGVVSDAVL